MYMSQTEFEWKVQKMQLLQLIESQKKQISRETALECKLLAVYEEEEQLLKQMQDSNENLLYQIAKIVQQNMMQL